LHRRQVRMQASTTSGAWSQPCNQSIQIVRGSRAGPGLRGGGALKPRSRRLTQPINATPRLGDSSGRSPNGGSYGAEERLATAWP
jgi:hypothetical protein